MPQRGLSHPDGAETGAVVTEAFPRVVENPVLPEGWFALVGTVDHVFCKYDEEPPRFFKWDGEKLNEQ